MATAFAEDLQRVAHVAEAGVSGDPMRPRLDLRTFDLHRIAARPAHQVMVMLVWFAGAGRATQAVRRLAVGTYDDVDRTVFRKALEVAVDGGESDLLVLPAQLVVQRLRGAEAVRGGESLIDRGTLAGGATTTCGERRGW